MNLKVPFIDLTRTSRRFSDSTLPLWKNSIETASFLGGPAINDLEALLQKTLDAPFAATCANGTDALILMLQAQGIGPGEKVALPNLTFWATYEAVVQLGATPVLIDVNSEDLQLSYRELQIAHEKYNLDACILVHLLGWCSADLLAIRTFCENNKIFLLEDAAQAFGVNFKGESIFKSAVASTLSFYPAKVIGGCMDGGGITARSSDLIEKCRSLANHGRKTHYSYSAAGWNSRMAAMNAQYLNQVIAQSSTILNDRRQALQYYSQKLTASHFGKHFALRQPPTGCEENSYLAVLELKSMSPEHLAKKLDILGVKTGRVYPETIDQQESARSALRSSDLAVSTDFCKKVINLPLFWGITLEEQDWVILKLEEALS